MEFEAFPKIARWSREIVITEKIDGTNGSIIIENGEIGAASRNRLLKTDDDNFGFANWVQDNKETLITDLGEGRHFGEWFGSGIQRGYGLKEKRFALFNVKRWFEAAHEFVTPRLTVVPILHEGENKGYAAEVCMELLRTMGSQAAIGFDKPEGIIIYHTAARIMFKKTFEKDEKGKGE
jgi:hypothetical protein